jgi:hypothetical protein
MTDQTGADPTPGKAQREAGKVVTTWRTVQSLDADAWRRLRDGAPFRFVRWLAALGIVGFTWYLGGTPKSAVAWLPVLVVVVLLLLPDASSVAFGGFIWQAREAADEAKQARDEVTATTSKIEVILRTGTEAGGAAGESAQARTAPQQPALEGLTRYLLARRSGTVDFRPPDDVTSGP